MKQISIQSNIADILSDVLNLTKLAPSAHVNAVMSRLVDEVIQANPNTFDDIDIQTVRQVQKICGNAESELEKFWSERVINSLSPQETLQHFPYIDNYRELTKRELDLVKASGLSLTAKSRVVIIGSGPLPLSAYEIFLQSGAIVDHVDSSLTAITLCQNFNTIMGVDAVHYYAKGATVKLTKTYDLVIIAALAGNTRIDKQQIVDNVLPNVSRGGRIVMRGVKDNRRLLYPMFLAQDIRGVSLVKEYHPYDHIVNSIFVFRH